MSARKIKRLRKKILGNDYISERIIKLSKLIDELNKNKEYYYVMDSNFLRKEFRGEKEKEIVTKLNDKKIKVLEKKISYYESKLY